jgi:putative sporulation protein YyaC
MAEPWPDSAIRVDAAGLSQYMNRISSHNTLNNMIFLCIGTDRSSGDCLGPWVGTLLQEAGFPGVIGTLEKPCDADELPKVIPTLPDTGKILALDAGLGRPESVGCYLVAASPLIPARSVGNKFPPLGTYSIAGIVNTVGPKPYWTLQNTSLFRVMNMARELAEAIVRAWRP